MKKAIVYILVFISLSANAQVVNRFRDSTWFAKGVRFDVPPYLIQGAGSGKVITSDNNGRMTWQTFTASGVSQGALNDSIARLDSTINATQSALNDTASDLHTLINTKGNGTVTSIATDNTLSGGTITTSGTLKVDTTKISTKANVTGLLLDKQNNLVSGTNIKTINSNSLLGSGNIITPDAQTLTVGVNTLTISGGNTVNLNRKVDTSYFGFGVTRDTLVFNSTINGVYYRYPVRDSFLANPITSTSTITFTNKRITARVDSTTSSATPTINTDNVDTYKLTAQSVDITSFTTNLSGTPTDDQILHIVIIGTATRAITWGSKFEASTVVLPTTTVGTNRLDVYFIWNTATSKWRCGGVW